MHQKLDDETDRVYLPEKNIPLTTEEELKEELPCIVKASLEDIQKDAFNSMPESCSGGHIIQTATALITANLSFVYALLLSHLIGHISSNISQKTVRQRASGVFRWINKLRLNVTFLEQMKGALSDLLPANIPRIYIKPFIQRFLTEFTTNYFKRQNQLLNMEATNAAESVTENDREVIHYICGYLIHSLRKRYYRVKSDKGKQMLSCLDALISSNPSEKIPSSWTDSMNRGGLKMPCLKFFTLIVQIERWVRDVVNVKRLHSDSLVNLKSTLLDYNLLKVSWEKILASDVSVKWIVLEHVLSLFLKVRGFAVTRLIRKTVQLHQKEKVKAGSKGKAVRRELKARSEQRQ